MPKKGYKQTENHRLHNGKAHLGKKRPSFTKEHRQHLKDNHWTKRDDCKQISQKISQGLLGYKQTKEHIQKTHTLERNKKASKTLKDRKLGPQTKEHIQHRIEVGGHWPKGKHRSKITKQKIREGNIKAWADHKFDDRKPIENPSKISQQCFWELYNGLSEEDRKNCYFAEHNGEYKIGIKQVDFCIPFKKLIKEFYGNYFHMNPKLFRVNDFNKKLNLTAQQIWDRDKKRIKYLENQGYKVIIIWEDEYRNNKNLVDRNNKIIKVG